MRGKSSFQYFKWRTACNYTDATMIFYVILFFETNRANKRGKNWQLQIFHSKQGTADPGDQWSRSLWCRSTCALVPSDPHASRLWKAWLYKRYNFFGFCLAAHVRFDNVIQCYTHTYVYIYIFIYLVIYIHIWYMLKCYSDIKYNS